MRSLNIVLHFVSGGSPEHLFPYIDTTSADNIQWNLDAQANRNSMKRAAPKNSSLQFGAKPFMIIRAGANDSGIYWSTHTGVIGQVTLFLPNESASH